MADKFIIRLLNEADPQAQYNAITEKDPQTLYLLSTGVGYLGSTKLFDSNDSNSDVIRNLITDMTSDSFTPDDTTVPSTKAIVEFVNKVAESNQKIKTASSPKIWELEAGLYRVQNGFYYTNEKEIRDIQESFTGIISPENPGAAIPGHMRLLSDALLFVYKMNGSFVDYICDFTVFGGSEEVTYRGSINQSVILLGPDEDNLSEYTQYTSSFVANTKTTSINESSTNEQFPSAKAVYDFVQASIQEALYVDDTATV